MLLKQHWLQQHIIRWPRQCPCINHKDILKWPCNLIRPMPRRQAQGEVQKMQPLPQPGCCSTQTTGTAITAPAGLGKSTTKSSSTYSTNGARTGIIASTTASNTATSSIKAIISLSRRVGFGPVTRRPMAWHNKGDDRGYQQMNLHQVS